MWDLERWDLVKSVPGCFVGGSFPQCSVYFSLHSLIHTDDRKQGIAAFDKYGSKAACYE